MLLHLRTRFFLLISLALIGVLIAGIFWLPTLYFLIIIVPIYLVGIYDVLQRKSNILRNYPLWGHLRYILMSFRPQIQQYFIMNDQNGRPFNKEMRDLVYNRANHTLDELPFGSQHDMDVSGYEWLNQSLAPTIPNKNTSRVTIGNSQCSKPYSASRLNISAMSFGALSQNAIRSLNRGAKLGNFAHNTGEGGLSQYHLQENGDIVWQIGTGYFGCRNKADGSFNSEEFSKKAKLENVKMIEIKLSQGAKPAHGGILPAPKVSREIASSRLVEPGVDCISPPAHSAFSTPIGLLEFVKQLRELSGGKPVGFKLCLGAKADFMSICKAMLQTKIYPDFITVDGAEGGTGAAPVEFTDHIGTPLNEGLTFVHNCLIGISVRHHIKIICSGKIISGFDMAAKIALGADLCNSARGMLFAVGCVQSRKCHTNECPTGIATQDPKRMYAVNIDDKAPRVKNFHNATIESFLAVLGAAGLKYAEELTPRHIHRRIEGTKELSYRNLYDYLEEGALLNNEMNLPNDYRLFWEMACANHFPSFDSTYKEYLHKDKVYLRKSELEK